MLLSVVLPPSTGTTVPHDYNGIFHSKIANVGDMENKGIELASSYKYLSQQGLGLTISGTFTKNINKVTSLGDNLQEIPITQSVPAQWREPQQDITTYMKPGYAAGSFFLIPTDGIIKDSATLEQVRTYMPLAEMGDVKYIDVVITSYSIHYTKLYDALASPSTCVWQGKRHVMQNRTLDLGPKADNGSLDRGLMHTKYLQ